MAEMTRPEGRALPTGTVTFLLTDIESSTQRWERSPDAMKQAMVAHDELLSRAIPQHAGTHVESGREGDSVLAAFTRATDAVACAIQVQRELAARTWPEGADLHLRMAIHSGEVEARSGHYYGQAVYRCARLLATAHGDQVLVSHATRDLIVDSLPSCVNPVRAMIDAYDRYYGTGSGEAFFMGPYLDILPRAVGEWIAKPSN